MAKDLMATQTGGVDTSTSPDVSQQNTQTQDLSPKEKKESTEAADLGIPADVKPSASSFELPSSRQNFTDEAIKNAIPETKIEEPKQQDPANQQLIANSAPAKVLGIQPTEAPQNTNESTIDKELESKQDVPADVVTQEDEQNKSILKELGINANFSKNAYGSLSEDPTNLRIDLDSYSGTDFLPDTEESDYDSEEIISDFTRDEEGFPVVDDNYDLAKSNLELKGKGVRLDSKGALIDVDETEDGEPKPDGFYSLGGRNYQKLNGNWLVKVNGKYVPLSSGDVERRKMTLESSAVMSKQPKKIIQETIEFAGIPIDAETRRRDANNIFQQKKSKEFSEQAIGDYTSKFQEGGEYSNIFKEAGIESPLPDGTYKYPGKQNVEYLKKDGAWYINNNPTGKGKGKDEFVPLTYGVKDRIISLERTARLKGTAEEETKASKQVKKNVEQALNTSFNEVSDVVSAYTQAGQSIYSFVKNLADKYNVSDEAFNIALKKAANGTLAESDEQVLQSFGSFYNDLEEIRLPVKTGGEFDLSRLFEYNMASPFEKYNLDGTLNPMFNESLFDEYNSTLEGKIGQLKQDAPLSVMNVGNQWDAIAKGSAAAKLNVQLGKIKAPGFYRAGNEVFRADGYGRWFDDDGNLVNDAGVIAALNSNGISNITSDMKVLINGSEVADIPPEKFSSVSKSVKQTNLYKLIKGDEGLQAYLNSVLLDARENKYKLGADFQSINSARIGKLPALVQAKEEGKNLGIGNFYEFSEKYIWDNPTLNILSNPTLNTDEELDALPIIEMFLDYDTTPEYWEKYQPEEGSLDMKNANMGIANSFINKAISEYYATKESELKARNFVSHNLGNLLPVLTADQLEGLKSYQNFIKIRLEEMDNNLTRSTEAYREFKEKANEINNTITDAEFRALNSAPAKERKGIFKKIKKRQDNEVKELKKETLADVSANQFISKDLSQTMSNAQTYIEEANNINMYLKDLQNKGININQDLYEKKTKVLNQIPILGSTNSLNYGTSTEGDQLNTAMSLFKETKDMTDYMLTQVNDGNLIIQPDGSFDFALKGVTEEEIATIQATLDRYNQNINKYLSEKEVENKQERAEISSKIKNTNLDISNLSDRLRKATSTEEINKLQKGIDELTDNKYNLERDLQQKREESSAILLTDAPFLVGRVTSFAPVDLSKTILSAIPKDASLSPKNKFDLYFNGLVEELNKAKQRADIDHSRLERASMKIRDLLDWNTIGLSLTKEEKEYLQLLTTVKQLMPLYMNNSASFSKESQGFFESFNQGMMNSFFPTTSKALGGDFMGADMRNEREAANVYMKVLNDIGLTEEDLNPTAVQEIGERGKETDLSDLEFWGQQTGLTAAIMYSFVTTRNVYNTGFNALKRTEKLLTGVTGLTKSEQVYTGIANTYDKLMDMNATTRFLKVPMAYGVQFEQAGQLIGAQEKELTFTAGLIGGIFAEGFAVAAKNMTPAQVKSYLSGVFKENTPRVFKAIENASRVTGFGVGETAQELGEEMAHAWEESENGKNFYDVLEEKFGTFDKASKFFVSTFVMGSAFGLATNSQRAKRAYDALPENMRQRVDQTIQMYQREMSAVQSAMDEYLSDNIENDVRSSVAEVITQEQTTTRDDKKDKQRVSGEVREGQESVQAEPVEGSSAQEVSDGGMVQGEQGQTEEVAPNKFKESGFNPEDNLFNTPDLSKNKTHGWRTMNEEEFNSLASGEKTYEGGAPKRGNWIAGVPQSAAKFGKKGAVMVEFGGVNMQGAENMEKGSKADKSNVTKVWRYNNKTNKFEEAPDLLDKVKKSEKIAEPTSKQKTEKQINNEVNSLLDDLKDLDDNFGVINMLTDSDGNINVNELLNAYNDKKLSLEDTLSDSQNKIIKEIKNLKEQSQQKTEVPKTEEVAPEEGIEFAGIPIREGKAPQSIESERVTLNNTTSPDNPFQISYSIDVDGSSVGEVTGRYDSKGNFIIDDISVSEGEQGKEIASETIDAISSETGGRVIISADSDNAARVGESFEKKGNATRNENGDFVVEPIQEATQEEETQQEPTEEKPLEEREPKSVADKLRRLKIKRTKGDGGITLYAGLPVDPMREGFKAAWNGAIETLATVIEKGGTAITNVKEALKQSKIRFQNSNFYQNLQTREEKAEQMALFLEAVQNELEDKRIIEQEEVTNQAIEKAEKKFKQSEWYKNLDLKGKRNALKQFRDAMRQEAESKSERMSAEERQKAKEFGEKVNEVTGVTKPNPIQRIKERELIARSMKDRSRGAKDLKTLIKEATDYANTHLPKDEYSKKEVSSLLKKIAKVKDVNSLDKVLGEIDTLISKKEENFRKNSARDTQKRIQDIKRGKEITTKKGNRKVGSIDIEARKELDDFLKSINVDDMSNRSLEEIQAINDVIDGIIETGKADKNAVDRAKKANERTERAKIMEGWRTSKDHRTNVNGVSEILEHLNQPGATVVVDGQLMGKSDFNQWLRQKKKEFKEGKKAAATSTTTTTPTTPAEPTMSPEEEQSLRSQLEEINGFISSGQERIDELEREKVGNWINLDAKDIASINKEISYLRDAISNYQTEVDKIQAQLDNAAKPQQEETKEDIFEETQMESFNRIKKMKKGSPEQQQAINEFNDKFGNTYERVSKIDSKFASIVSALESNKLIEKDC